jgi:hypothetical protein
MFVTGDTNMPNSISIDACPYCPSYLFMSEAEKKRHLSVLHHDKKGIKNIFINIV